MTARKPRSRAPPQQSGKWHSRNQRMGTREAQETGSPPTCSDRRSSDCCPETRKIVITFLCFFFTNLVHVDTARISISSFTLLSLSTIHLAQFRSLINLLAPCQLPIPQWRHLPLKIRVLPKAPELHPRSAPPGAAFSRSARSPTDIPVTSLEPSSIC